MKDQFKLLKDCLHNDIPAVVFQGDDKCAIKILEIAKQIYKEQGCSEEFLYDWQLLINEFNAYQQEYPDSIKLPGISLTQTEMIREEMARATE